MQKITKSRSKQNVLLDRKKQNRKRKNPYKRHLPISTFESINSKYSFDKLLYERIIGLAIKSGKFINDLNEFDYRDNGLGHIFNSTEVTDVNRKVYARLKNTIFSPTETLDSILLNLNEIVVFSPHPDDDVIGMGGTIEKLIKLGYSVHVIYMTSGYNGVKDIDEVRSIRLNHLIQGNGNIKNDAVKKYIRRAEAEIAAEYLGVKSENIHFLDLPFYENRKSGKGLIGEKDLDIVFQILKNLQPTMIFAAGDFKDPNGTHKQCFDVLLEAVNKIRNQSGLNDGEIWLYNSAWDDIEIHDIDLALPLDKNDLNRKLESIRMHASQMKAKFKGENPKEFDERAEYSSRRIAEIYCNLGITKAVAMEVFKKFSFATSKEFY